MNRYNMCHESTRHWKGDPKYGSIFLRSVWVLLAVAACALEMGKERLPVWQCAPQKSF